MSDWHCSAHRDLPTPCTIENCWQAERSAFRLMLHVEHLIEQTHDAIFGPASASALFTRQSFSLAQIRSLTRAIRVAHEHGIEMDAYPVPLDLSWRWRLGQRWRRWRGETQAVARQVERG